MSKDIAGLAAGNYDPSANTESPKKPSKEIEALELQAKQLEVESKTT